MLTGLKFEKRKTTKEILGNQTRKFIENDKISNTDAIKEKAKDMRARGRVFDFGWEGNKIFLQRC